MGQILSILFLIPRGMQREAGARWFGDFLRVAFSLLLDLCFDIDNPTGEMGFRCLVEDQRFGKIVREMSGEIVVDLMRSHADRHVDIIDFSLFLFLKKAKEPLSSTARSSISLENQSSRLVSFSILLRLYSSRPVFVPEFVVRIGGLSSRQ